MWLDAFIKPNSADMQKARVSGVSRVSAHHKPNEYKGLGEKPLIDTGIKRECQSVSAVSNQINTSNRLTPLTPADTGIKSVFLHIETPRQPNEYKGLAHPLTPLTRLTPQKQDAREFVEPTLEAFEKFRFDLVQQDIEDGYPAEELSRVNNMAWEFMRVDGMGFDEAIRAAAEIVAHTQIAACEAAYTDVMAMFSKYKEGKTHHAKD